MAQWTLAGFYLSSCLPIIIILTSIIVPNSLLLAIGLIGLAHIGMDRMVGYGLKYPTAFKDTHLNRV